MKHLILDIDETLVTTLELTKENLKLAKRYRHHINKEFDIVIIERTGLQAFLTFCFKHYKVSIWTAGTARYGEIVIQHCILTKPNRQLEYYLHRSHHNESIKMHKSPKRYAYLINTLKLNFNLKDTLLIDNCKENCRNQGACINVEDFVPSKKDDVLPKLVKLLKTSFI